MITETLQTKGETVNGGVFVISILLLVKNNGVAQGNTDKTKVTQQGNLFL